jgi:hypothetical protein
VKRHHDRRRKIRDIRHRCDLLESSLRLDLEERVQERRDALSLLEMD